jgi:hypothetical protein
MSGVEVMTGKTIDIQGSLGLPSSQTGRIDPEPLAALALLASVAALLCTLVPNRVGLLAGAASSAVAFGSLLLAKFSIDNRVNQPATFSFTTDSPGIPAGMVVVATYEAGYWLALVLSAASAGVLFYLWSMHSHLAESTSNLSYPPGAIPPI